MNIPLTLFFLDPFHVELCFEIVAVRHTSVQIIALFLFLFTPPRRVQHFSVDHSGNHHEPVFGLSILGHCRNMTMLFYMNL